MNIRRLFKSVLLAVICAGMVCACGGNTPSGDVEQETNPHTQFQPSTETTEAAETKEASITDLYEKTDLDRVYKLSNVDTDGYGVVEAHLKDGYVLLLMHDYSEEGYESEYGVEHLLSSGKLVLFPLAHPDKIASLDVEQFIGRYQLLADGQVAALGWEGDYTLYDSNLEEMHSGDMDCRAVLGASDEGGIWVVAENSMLSLYQDGEEVQRIPVEEVVGGSYRGEKNGKAYFSLNDEVYDESWVSVNLTDWSVEKQPLLTRSYEFSHGWIEYGSENKWYVTDMEDPYIVTEIDKPFSDEYAWGMDENYLIGMSAYLDTSENFRHSLRIYDRKNGGLCDAKDSTELAGEEFILYDYDQGMVLYGDSTADMATKGLYLWDLNGLTSHSPATNYVTVDYHVDQTHIDSMIQEIYDRYGVKVYYDQAHLDEYTGGFYLPENEDRDVVGYALIRLIQCMEEYPEGFFQELQSKDYYSSIVYYLSGMHEKISPDTIDHAAGTVSFRDDVLQMSLDVNYWWNFRSTFLHENMHMIDNVLQEENAKLYDRNIFDYWYKVMNDPEIASLQHYNYEQSEENMKGIYSFGEDPEEAWYIDAYSKSTMAEDRARILEHSLYSASDCYFESSHINRKARCINAMLRDVFECVKNSEEPVLWEARTGIVDLREEFPDFLQ